MHLLEELDRAHAQLIEALNVMAEQTTRPEPDTSGFSSARWRLSTASRLRRRIVASIIAELLPRLDGPAASSLKRFQGEDAQSLHQSSAHIHRWTPQTIATEWLGYCSASLEMRRSMRRRLAAERAIFHPMLRALAEASA